LPNLNKSTVIENSFNKPFCDRYGDYLVRLYSIEDNVLSQFSMPYQYPITIFLILIDNSTRPKSPYNITDGVL